MEDLPKIITLSIIFILMLILIFDIELIVLFLPQRSYYSSVKFVQQENMKLASPIFEDYRLIPKKYTCDGQDINPPLTIEGAPSEAKSFVLMVDDPDSPSGKFTHWLVWNIDPQTKEIKENSIPANAVSGANDFGKTEYGGPCPSVGVHRYFFKFYALDIILNLSEGTGKSALEDAMKGHILGQTQLIGRYGR